MRIGIIGAGAIGVWLAARLVRAGQPVSLLARGVALAAIRQRGIVLTDAHGSAAFPVRASDDPAELGEQDLLITAVKAPALPALAPRLAPMIGVHTMLTLAVNGLPWWFFQVPGRPCSGRRLLSVDADGAQERHLPLAQTLGLSVFASCSVPEPASVRHAAGQRLVFGEPAGGLSPRVERVLEVFRAAGFDAQGSQDIRQDIWLKLLGNACFNPVSVLTGAATDEMIDDPALRRLFVRMLDEAIDVGGRLGLARAVSAEQRIGEARKLGHIKTSTLQDFEAGRALEIDAILGALVECAGAVAMPVPALESVLALARMRARSSGLLPQ